jgi:hypothetical protein
MSLIINILSSLAALGMLVCWIMEIIAAFQKGKGPLMGILSIIPCFSLGGFIIGWIHAGKWGLQKIMLIWTILLVVSIVLGVAGGGFALPSADNPVAP